MIRDPAQENRERNEAIAKARDEQRQRAIDLADEVFATPAGRELLEHLCAKFHLRGRTFLTPQPHASACPFAAAVRDGERVPVNYLIDLARAANPKFIIP